jgi:hypothetical protein
MKFDGRVDGICNSLPPLPIETVGGLCREIDSTLPAIAMSGRKFLELWKAAPSGSVKDAGRR